MVDENPLWTTSQVADFLGFPVSALNKWRRIRMLRERIRQCQEGSPGCVEQAERKLIEETIEKINGPKLEGPPFIRIGEKKVRYRKSDVLSWAEDPK